MNELTSNAIHVIDVWRQLDAKHNRLVKLKTQAAAKQVRKEIKAETMQIRFRNRGNLNSGIIPSEILAMERRKIDAWASQYYTICCDVWELQGNKKSAALVRTIYTHFLRRLIAIRKSSVAHEAQRSARATGRFDNIVRLLIESFERSADQLSRDWAQKIEIEALELEARERLEKSSNQASFISRTAEASRPGAESTPHTACTKGAMPRKPSTRTKGIASGSTPLQPANQSTSQSSADPRAGLVSTHSSAPLSAFEATVGELMVKARGECPTKHLPQTELLKISALLDSNSLPVRDNLEREAARALAEYNQRHPMSAIKSWRAALGLPQFRRSVRKRFSRAEEKYKKATVSVAQSAGNCRTTI